MLSVQGVPKKGGRRRSSIVEAHDMYRLYHQDTQDDLEDGTGDKTEHKEETEVKFPMFTKVQKTGVIYATSRAVSKGFSNENPEWANMGQGAPETGPIPGAPSRKCLGLGEIPDVDLEYAPVTGLHELREKIAVYYNHLYRKDKQSQYSAENICVVPGGRAGISRIMVSYRVIYYQKKDSSSFFF